VQVAGNSSVIDLCKQRYRGALRVQEDPDALHATGRPAGFADAASPYLRWGTTRVGGQHIDDWSGWGWRHIVAKHGWSEEDEAATRQALEFSVTTTLSRAGAMWYAGIEYERNGAICQRLVLVDYNVDAESGEPVGVRTSFGGFIRNAP
jgi:hypothetical protein